MKSTTFIGLGVLAITMAACAAPSASSEDRAASQTAPIQGQPVVGCVAPQPAPQTPNPAASYCTSLGYQTQGDQCAFADGTSCDAWDFYRGACGQPHSFCNRSGGSVSSKTENMGGWTATYAVCSFPDGRQCKEDALVGSCVCDAPPAPPPVVTPPPAPACAPLQGGSGIGTPNPAAVYCTGMGYALDGDQCAFPDGTRCDSWDFYRGACGQAHSFCNRGGGSVSSKTEDMGGWTAAFAVCSFADGKSCRESDFAQSCVCE